MNALAQSAVFGLVAVPSLAASRTTGRGRTRPPAAIHAVGQSSAARLLEFILRSLTACAVALRYALGRPSARRLPV